VSDEAYVLSGYRLTNLMMAGQASQVWEAIQEGTGRRFAVKTLLPEKITDPEHRKYLEVEAKVGMQMHHPKIIKIFEYHPHRENPHFIMEFFAGNNLKQRIMRKSDIVFKHMPEIIEQAGQALAYMHDKRWLHKDIKPDNVMVNGAGEVRLIDFALAERLGGAIARLFARKSGVKGTRSYMSPEQIRGQRLDERADLYSFGCMLFEMVVGRPPFRADSPKALLEKHLYEKVKPPMTLNSALTVEMNDLIMRMLSKDPKGRFENMHEFLAKFRGVRIFSRDPLAGTASS
jgi:serine/threonine protein kinase